MTSIRDRKLTKSKAQCFTKPDSRSHAAPAASHVSTLLKVLLPALVVVGGAMVWLLGDREDDGMILFTSARQVNKQLVHPVKCSDDYKTEAFKECVPTRCARVVMDNLVTEEEARILLNLAMKGFVYGGSSGGASILDLHSGALSKGDKFINVYKILPDGEFSEEEFQLYRSVKGKIHQAIAGYFNIPASKLFLTKPTFFSRMNTTEAKTIHDEYWHPHVDKVTYGSFHYTSLLYLATYGQDFSGGRFVFIDNDGNRTVEPKLGRVSFFTSGSENMHYVEKLKSGTRFAITISFTCDPDKAIADP